MDFYATIDYGKWNLIINLKNNIGEKNQYTIEESLSQRLPVSVKEYIETQKCHVHVLSVVY